MHCLQEIQFKFPMKRDQEKSEIAWVSPFLSEASKSSKIYPLKRFHSLAIEHQSLNIHIFIFLLKNVKPFLLLPPKLGVTSPKKKQTLLYCKTINLLHFMNNLHATR